MPRFVLLRHDCPPTFGKPSHWDLMLEWEGSLRTWELRNLPTDWATALAVADSGRCVEARQLADHRLAYLDYEGPLTGDRGSVSRCDCGNYEVLSEMPNQLEVKLSGHLIHGTFQLERAGQFWQLTISDA